MSVPFVHTQERKDRRILELEQMVAEARAMTQDAERRAGEGIELQDRLREKVRRLAMQVESRTMDKLVKQLKAQLLAKEKKPVCFPMSSYFKIHIMFLISLPISDVSLHLHSESDVKKMTDLRR